MLSQISISDIDFTDWAFYTKKYVKMSDIMGVYQLTINVTDQSQITYIGHGNIRSELLKFILGDKCKSPSMFFRYLITDDEEKAKRMKNLLLKDFQNKYGKLPRCNS
jgi:hypothetical protein